MVRFVRETVESVLAQDYPRIEHIVVDGGSTDGTLDALRDYEDRVIVRSEPDGGPADAINKGIRQTSGGIVAFLNADDCYLPGAVSAAVQRLAEHPEAAAVYGEGQWVDESGQLLGPYPVGEFDPDRLRQECYICQPSAFLRRKALEEIGLLDASLQYTFDYDLWIRLASRFSMVKTGECLSATRMHRDTLSLGSRKAVLRETIQLLRRHFDYVPFGWVHSYCSHLLDRRDQFFEPLKPGFTKYLLSLPVGVYHNRRHPFRYLNEWRRVMTTAGMKRRLAATWLGKTI